MSDTPLEQAFPPGAEDLVAAAKNSGELLRDYGYRCRNATNGRVDCRGHPRPLDQADGGRAGKKPGGQGADGQGRAAQGAFDDRVMSFLLTIQMYLRSPFSSGANPIESLMPPASDVNDFNFDFNSGSDMLSGEVDFEI